MSKRMSDTFFPATVELLSKTPILSTIYHDWVFPDEVAEACPEYVWKTTTPTSVREIRQPCLLAAAILGVWIGLSRGLIWWTRSNRYDEKMYQKSKSNIRQTHQLWSIAFAAFGFMNLSAIWAHCLLTAPSIDYPTDLPNVWAMDTFMTGVSGSALLIAGLQDLHRCHWVPELPMLQFMKVEKTLYRILPTGLIFIGFVSLAAFFVDPVSNFLEEWSIRSSMPLEQWYLSPSLCSSTPIGLLVLGETILSSMKKNRSSHKLVEERLTRGQVGFLGSVVCIFVLGVGLDHFWCPLFGNQASLIRDFWNANTLVFLGCDLAFYSLDLCLEDQQRNQVRYNASASYTEANKDE